MNRPDVARWARFVAVVAGGAAIGFALFGLPTLLLPAATARVVEFAGWVAVVAAATALWIADRRRSRRPSGLPTDGEE